ncbi:MAG: hypothetical protein KJ941_07380 [Bacteroidetes bacterium]|nr:hypothetical protein [Bacteroidota bacterium]
MEARIENIFKNKSYLDLTTEELMLVQDWAGNEEEFVQLKSIVNTAEIGVSNLGPSPKVKENLDEIFRQKYPKDQKVIVFKPIYTIIVSAAAILLAIFWLMPEKNDVQQMQITENKKQETIQPKSKIESLKDKTEVDETFKEPIQIAKNETLQRNFSEPPSHFLIEETNSSFGKESSPMHVDFLEESSLKKGRKELVSQNPLIFEVLHTSF